MEEGVCVCVGGGVEMINKVGNLIHSISFLWFPYLKLYFFLYKKKVSQVAFAIIFH